MPRRSQSVGECKVPLTSGEENRSRHLLEFNGHTFLHAGEIRRRRGGRLQLVPREGTGREQSPARGASPGLRMATRPSDRCPSPPEAASLGHSAVRPSVRNRQHDATRVATSNRAQRPIASYDYRTTFPNCEWCGCLVWGGCQPGARPLTLSLVAREHG